MFFMSTGSYLTLKFRFILLKEKWVLEKVIKDKKTYFNFYCILFENGIMVGNLIYTLRHDSISVSLWRMKNLA
jgi:hypothetical protein